MLFNKIKGDWLTKIKNLLVSGKLGTAQCLSNVYKSHVAGIGKSTC